MMMRRDAIVVERSRRTRSRAGVLGIAAAVALVGGIAAWRTTGNEPPAAPAHRPGPDVARATTPPLLPAGPAATGSASAALDHGPTTHTPDAQRSPAHSTTAQSAGDRPDRNPSAGQRSSKASGDSRGRRELVGDRGTTTLVGASVGRTNPDTSTTPPASAGGWYAIDSSPYATIFVDDRKIGDTPLDRIPLSAGAHRVRAVLTDGRQRSFAIDIAADRKTSSGTLTW
jgi:hypothetical protein